MSEYVHISECLNVAADVISDYLKSSPKIADQICNVKSLSELKAIHMTLKSACSLLKKEIETSVINHYENKSGELVKLPIAIDYLNDDFNSDSDITIFINNDIRDIMIPDDQLVDNAFNWGISICVAHTNELLDRITQALGLPEGVRLDHIKCVNKSCHIRLSDGSTFDCEIVPTPLNDMFGALFGRLFINLTNDIDKNKQLTCGNVSCARLELSDLGLNIIGGAFFGKAK